MLPHRLQNTNKTGSGPEGSTQPGTLWIWGVSAFGQLGNNAIINLSSPIQVGTVPEWVSVSTGDNSTLAIKANGTLWAWGTGSYGALGVGDTVGRSSPTQVGTLSDWKQVSAGWQATAAIKVDGTLWTWGRDNAGRLGHNVANNTHRSSPTQVGGLSDWKVVVMGNDHIVALRNNGTMWTWGYGATGRLGQNDTASRSSPTQVGTATDWESISAEYHSFAVKTNGQLWGWGVGTFGRIGAGDAVDRSSPTQIGTLTDWKHASAGSRHSIALKTDGTLWGWGYNLVGQVGDNSSVQRSSPVQVGALTTWASVSAKGGADSAGANDLRLGLSLAVKNDGTLWSWGENNGGRLGNQGDTPDTNVSSPGQVGTLKTWRGISAGGAHGAAIQLPTPYQNIALTDDGDAAASSGGGTSSHTFSSQTSTGPHSFILCTFRGAEGITLSSATWNGDALTILVQDNRGTGSSIGAAILYIAGSKSGNVVLNFSLAADGSQITKVSLDNLTSSTPVDTDLLDGNGATISLAALTSPGAGGVRLTCWANFTNSAVVWTNAYALSDVGGTGATWRHSAAYDFGDDSGTITADGATDGQCIVGASMH